MLLLSQPPYVDRGRGGILRISTTMLAALLRLPLDMQIVGVCFDTGLQCWEIVIQGEPMPRLLPGREPAQVDLIVEDDGDVAGFLRRRLHFRGRPDTRWLLSLTPQDEGFP